MAPHIFEVTWFPGANDETQADFETGHIANAFQMDVQSDLSIPVGDEAKLNFTRDTGCDWSDWAHSWAQVLCCATQTSFSTQKEVASSSK